jgi:hypothetical protein
VKIKGWEICKDEKGFYADDASGQSCVRVTEEGAHIATHDGYFFVPNEVVNALDALIECNCDPLEQTGNVHKRTCPAYQPEWETPER